MPGRIAYPTDVSARATRRRQRRHLHRIVRRGITYGPPYDPAHPRDGKERGLLGLFIGVSLRDQFEFLMAEWANDGIFTAGFGGTKDPLIGAQADSTGSFSIPSPEGPMVLPGLPRFVTTRGGAYCFLPSITAIRYLANSLPEIVDPVLQNTSVHSGQ